MPIIGLSDQGASFPRIGTLRKGAPKPKNGNRPGKDLDHFRFTSEDEDALESFRAAYGDKPDSINVFLPFDSTDENFESWVEQWGKSSLKWRGNGKTLVVWQKSDGTYSQEPKPQPEGGKEIGRLKVIIPELKRLAYVVALTTSVHDIAEISQNLRAYEALRGSLQGIPFVLSRVPRMVSVPIDDGKRARVEKHLLHLEAAPNWVQSQLSLMRRQALPDAGELLALESGDVIDADTGEILHGEVMEADEPKPPEDTRAAASPQAQAKRERPKAEPDGDIDWKDRAMGQKFTTFASCLVNAGVGYKSEEHVENALGTMGEEWNPDESDRLWDLLVERKAEKEAA